MPDFERLTRSLEIELSKTKEQMEAISAKHHKQDVVRFWVAVSVFVLAVIYSIRSFLQP